MQNENARTQKRTRVTYPVLHVRARTVTQSQPATPTPHPAMQKLYVCEFTLNFFQRREQLLRHVNKVRLRQCPGDEVYRGGNPVYMPICCVTVLLQQLYAISWH
jgi:hypothetical protein